MRYVTRTQFSRSQKGTTDTLPLRRRERGTSFVEAALVSTFVLIPLLLGIIDFGRAYFFSIEVANAAKAAAQFGAQSTAVAAGGATSTTILNGIVTAAQNEAPDIAKTCTGGPGACWATNYPLAQWGCECSNTSSGTGSDSCSLSSSSCNHLVDFVMVTTQATYTPFFNFFGLFKPITLSSQAKVRMAPQ